MKFRLDLTKFFEKECKTLISSYKSLLSKKQGISLDNAPSNKKATIKKKGKDHWLIDTEETKNKGFKSTARPKRMTVFASDDRHSGKYTYVTKAGVKMGQSKNPPTYQDIFEWHNTANARYSGIFQYVPVGSKLFDRLDAEIEKQVNSQITKMIMYKFKRFK